MFNLESAAVTLLVLLGLTALLKTLAFGTNKERAVVGLCFLGAFVTIMLVAASDFSHEQIILNRALDTLNFASQLVIVVLATGLAAAGWEGFKSVRNIGENWRDPKTVP